MVGLIVALGVLSVHDSIVPTTLDGGLLVFQIPQGGEAIDDPALSFPDERMNGAWADGVPLTLDARFPSIVPLPRQTREVTVSLGPWPDSYVGDDAHFGSARALLASSLASDRTQAIVGLLLTVLGTLVLGAAVAWRKQSTTLLGLGLFAFATGMISIGQSAAWYPLIWPSAFFWYLVRMVTVSLYAIGFAVMSIGLFGDTPRGWLRKLALGELGWLAISLALFASGLVRFRVLRRGAYALLFAIIVVALSQLWKRRKSDPVARTFLVSFVLLVGFGVPDILWGMGVPLVTMHLAPLGLLAFVAGGAFMIAERAAEQRRAAESALADVNTLNLELRHQLEQRSRDLKEHFAADAGVQRQGDELQTGQEIGRYMVREKLGAGAMGAVYAVSRVSDGKRFALKMLTGKVTRVEAARFAQEAEIAARLSHPNLVGIVDVARLSTGLVYLVLELVEGRTLEAARPEFGKFAATTRVLHGLSAGLSELHRAGFVHRDLKPGNILLARDAEGELARITDFGVASEVDVETSTLASRLKLTTTGAWVGTPLYMAPEMVRGASSRASDVFALGIIAFELALGRYPFVEPPIIAVLSGRTAPAVDWGTAQLEPARRKLIESALAADPTARPDATAFSTW